MVGTDSHGDETPRPIFRDIRHYCCEYCGICRSKKSLIVAHMKSQHKEELEKEEVVTDESCETKQSNTCDKCGATFKKPAYLKQHMQSHLLEDKKYYLRYTYVVMWREALDPNKELQNA